MTAIRANDPKRTSFITVDANSDFPIQNLPFGVAEIDGENRVVSAIGNQVVDLVALHELGALQHKAVSAATFRQSHINTFMALGKATTRDIRNQLSDALLEGSDYADRSDQFLHPMASTPLKMPVDVGDYTDFYSSIEHATNVGTMFRDPDNALLPNWRHLPVGYHGRASSIVVSGTPIHRPVGQTKPDPDQPPVFGPCKLLDFELEMAFVLGKSTSLGNRISTAEAEDYIFGLTLFNDWSARDIQKWEYVPLGPFLAKSFASTITPWIVTLDALEPFRTDSPKQEPEVLSYLRYKGKQNFDLELSARLRAEDGATADLCQTNFKYMYWNMAQQLAHHSVNGCNFNVGDMCASGTISGKERSAFGSMLEISWKGTNPVQLSDGSERKFLADGDTLQMRGYGQGDGYRIGFGPCDGKVLPARPFEG